MADTPIGIVARLTSQVGKARALRDLLEASRRTARTFVGCRSWVLLINRGNPRECVIFSEWDNLTAYEARMRDASWIELTGRLPDLVEGELGFDLYDVIT
ncbi:MAG TPA: antibiotic biosynthesis monooxygenase family protein [Gemmatimonadales bacterium]|nr:antibiotic biosynthesis monooxygenase family protein [Gemmatimonadales bacterium]